jgi:very-short-patch-repair endonuclease
MAEGATELRQNTTDAERRLWGALRGRRLQGYKFRRQHPIGRFIVDFACTRHRLVIEADGGQHDESKSDARRTAWLESQGWRVIRFWNNDILANTEGVVSTILEVLRNGSTLTRLASRGTLLSVCRRARDAGEGLDRLCCQTGAAGALSSTVLPSGSLM